MIRKTIFFFLITLLTLGCNNLQKSTQSLNSLDYSIKKRVECENGAVVSAHPLASKIGLQILKLGGNAVDAAIATQLALAVVYPRAGNIGGGGFMIGRFTNGELIALDYREKAPGKASRDMYLDSAGNALTEVSKSGHLSSGVPGTVAGLFAAHQYAKLPFKQLIDPAIQLADKGFILTEGEASSFNNNEQEFRLNNTVRPVFVKNVRWNAGDTLIQKELANTLRLIRDQGSAGFYEGQTAKLIVEEMKRGKGLISLEDLRNYQVVKRKPLLFNYKEYEVIGMPMPSSGGLLLKQMMKMVENRNLGSLGFHTPQSVHLMAEVERRVYADRAEYMGDADFVMVPVEEISSDAYLSERMKDFNPSVASSSKEIRAGKLIHKESEETTHLSVIDKDGNSIAVTTTLNNSYGSFTVVAGAGFILNDVMDDFSIKPGVPNMYGAIGGTANAIQPNKRMLSAMTPTIILKDKKPVLIIGTPGGTTIPTSVFQGIMNMLEFGLSTEDAINKPKFHHQWLPDSLFVEEDFPASLSDALMKMGHKIRKRTPIGRTEAIRIRYDENGKRKLEAVGDKRGDDAAEGY